jgi:hypothetical protein
MDPDASMPGGRTRHVLTSFSVSLTRADALTSKVVAKLKIVRKEGLFSPHSSRPMYVL